MIKVLLILLGVLVLLGSTFGILVLVVSRKANARPDNNPVAFLADGGAGPEQKVWVALGDSITHGRVSANYVELVAEQLGPGWAAVNAGINGELAWNLTQRLDPVVACRPDAVTVLIGTNDTTASMSDEWGRRAMRRMGVPRLPDLEWYRECLTALVDGLGKAVYFEYDAVGRPERFQDGAGGSTCFGYDAVGNTTFFLPAEGKATYYGYVALSRLESSTDALGRTSYYARDANGMPIGHDRADPFLAQSVRTAAISDEVAAQAGVDLLPLHEVMVERLAELELPPTPPARRYLRVMYPAIFRRLLLGRS